VKGPIRILMIPMPSRGILIDRLPSHALMAAGIALEDPFVAARRVRPSANAAMAGLAGNVVFYLASVGFACFDLAFIPSVGEPSAALAHAMSDRVRTEGALSLVLLLVTGLCFLQWTSRAFQAARRLGAAPKRFTARSVIWGFMIPILNWFRPYQGLSALDAALDPLLLPEPPPRPEATAHAGGYRQAALAGGAPPREVRRPPLLGWWVLWIASSVLGVFRGTASHDWTALRVFDLIDSSVQAASAAMAIVVVRRFGLLFAERARRLAAR
jgi:hypothetical protein